MRLITRDIISPLIKLEEEALIYDYDDTIQLLNKWHAVFDHLGLNSGDEYITAGSLTLELITLLIAGAERGLVYNSPHTDDSINHVIDLHAGKIKAIIVPTEDPRGWPIQVNATHGRFQIEDVHRFSPVSPTFGELSENTPLLKGHTTGTTGPAKFYVHTHKSFYTSVMYNAKRFYKSTDVVACVGGINHTALITSQSLPILVAGCHAIYSKGLRRALFQTKASKLPNKVTVPQAPLLDFLQREPNWQSAKLDFIDEFFTGGAVLSRGSMAESLLRDKGVKKLTSLYGSSETGIVAALEVTLDTIEQKFSTKKYPLVGEFFSHVETKLDETHQILIKTDALANLIPLDSDGFFSPKDQIVIENGQWYISGRGDRSAKIQDIIVSLTRVEQLLIEFKLNGQAVIEKAHCFERDGMLFAAIKPVNEALGKLLNIAQLRQYITPLMSQLVTLNGFVLADQVIPQGGIKPVWKIDDLVIPEKNIVRDNPLPFKSGSDPKKLAQFNQATQRYVKRITDLRQATKIKT